MDAVFNAGKFKGRWFSDVAGTETAFCTWAKKQKSPPGYLRSFVEFLKSGSRRGQQSLDAHVVRSSREPRPPRAVDAEVTLKEGTAKSAGIRFDFTMDLELVSADEFDVGPEDANAEVPWTLRQALAARPDGRAAPSANHWRFPASSYIDVLRWLEWNPDFRCRVNGVPSWVLKHVPAFATAAEQVKATAALRLSAATRRLLAELPPAPAPSTPAGSSALSARMLPSAEDLKLDGLGGTLLPFQVEAVQYGLARNGRLLLGDEMGLGKTVTTLALVRHFKESWPFLVVAPAPLCKLWQEHALAWLKEDLKPHDVVLIRFAQDSIPSRARMVVVSYNLISDPKFQRKDDKDFDLVILDECHLLRGNSQRSKACVPLAKKAMRAILLTGTPLVARTQDAYPLLDALFDLCTPTDFAQRYAPSTSSRNQGRSARLNELHVLLGAAMLRRTKENTLSELPAKRRQRVLLDMSPSAEKEDVEEESERLAKTKSTAVAEYMSCLTSADVRFLVFAHHLAMLDELESSLQRASVTYIRIDGSTPMAERSKYIEAFQAKEAQVALLSLTACSQGFTLTSASLVLFAELYWVPGVLLQAEDRAHRLGQANMVNVQYLVAPGSVSKLTASQAFLYSAAISRKVASAT
ncbi:unnamed protein product [Durusdinium trenchii]|uniref:SWI/SNF-related matrix-associated actin-dependent regulator of chromatin subfamily A-like protein 1 n=1 Tax=Durusdinium trenchii TaxID=1381693 RepID=A0ABP0PEC5_9DINO